MHWVEIRRKKIKQIVFSVFVLFESFVYTDFFFTLTLRSSSDLNLGTGLKFMNDKM